MILSLMSPPRHAAEPVLNVGPDRMVQMSFKSQMGIIVFVAALALGYASLKFDQSSQGKDLSAQGSHLEAIDKRQGEIEKTLARMDGKLDVLATLPRTAAAVVAAKPDKP